MSTLNKLFETIFQENFPNSVNMDDMIKKYDIKTEGNVNILRETPFTSNFHPDVVAFTL